MYLEERKEEDVRKAFKFFDEAILLLKAHFDDIPRILFSLVAARAIAWDIDKKTYLQLAEKVYDSYANDKEWKRKYKHTYKS